MWNLKGMMQRSLPWLHWSWCYAHRLELACKNPKSTLYFDTRNAITVVLSFREIPPKFSRIR